MKKHIVFVSAFLVVVFGFLVVVNADEHSSYGLLFGSTHASDPTYLGKFYPKYWHNGVNYRSSYTLSLSKLENGLYMHKTTRYPEHTIGEKHIKFDGYGSGNYRVIVKASNGSIYGEYLLYSGDTYEATNVDEAI